MTPRPGLKLFLDRSTNSRRFAAGVRLLVADVVTIGERYGVGPAERVKDVQWLADATAEDRVCVGADRAILSNELELAAVLEFGARYVVFSNNNITSQEQLERFTACLPQIGRLADKRGPWVAVIERDGMRETDVSKLEERLARLRKRHMS